MLPPPFAGRCGLVEQSAIVGRRRLGLRRINARRRCGGIPVIPAGRRTCSTQGEQGQELGHGRHFLMHHCTRLNTRHCNRPSLTH